MLADRTGQILKSIVEQYIAGAVPVPSQRVATSELGVSSATIRNEMARLEEEGYILRPHPSAGSIPSDKGYRYYVQSLEDIMLSAAEQRLISHVFHQVEGELEKWVSLAATLIAQRVHNVAIVTIPKAADSKLKHLELVALQDALALVVVVLHGARVRQQLIIFEQVFPQPELTIMANKLNAAYAGLTSRQILAREVELSLAERRMTDLLVKMMQAEDVPDYEEPYLEGLHFMLNQPEFRHSQNMLGLMELVEHRSLLKAIVPRVLGGQRVQVIIGKENPDETFHQYSIVISKYGIPDEAVGMVSVLGPTRMPYAHAISIVAYLSSVLSELVAGLYGREVSHGQPGIMPVDDIPPENRAN